MASSAHQPRAGLIGGAVIFFVIGIFPAVMYFAALSSGERPTVASVAGIVVGFTGSAILAYWAARFNKSKVRFNRRDVILAVALAFVTGTGLSLAPWLAARGVLS